MLILLELKPKDIYKLEVENDVISFMSQELIEDLQSKDIFTVTELISYSLDWFMDTFHLYYYDAVQIRSNIFDQFRPPVISAVELLFLNKDPKPLGIKQLDDILGGGLYGGEILEICGPSGTGKSQMCISIAAAMCQKEEDYRVLYLDAKNDFRVRRFFELCNKSPEPAGQLVLIRESFVLDIIDIIEDFEVQQRHGEQKREVSVLILDSLAAVLNPCMNSEDDALRICQERLVQAVRSYAVRHNVIVIMTNHTVAAHQRSRGTGTEREEKLKPALGQYWTSVPNFRLFVKQSKHEARAFEGELKKSTRTPVNLVFEFKITEKGIE